MLDFRRRDMMSQKSNERSQETFKVARTNTSYLVVCVQCFAEKNGFKERETSYFVKLSIHLVSHASVVHVWCVIMM